MVSLKLFGGIALASDAGALAGPATQRRRLALLAILAASPGRSVSRDKLIALLWPESESGKARHLLADAVYEVRAALGKDTVRAVGDDLQLDPDVVRTDVAEFERALAEGARERAAAVYGAPFLDGFFISGAPEFERWTAIQRDRFARVYAGALERIAVDHEAAGDQQGATEWWRRLAAHDPYNSRVALRLMRVLEAAGDPAGAVQHARAHEAVLRTDLEVPPDPAVAGLVRVLQAPRSPPATHTQAAPDRVEIHPNGKPNGSAPPATNDRAPFRRRRAAAALLGGVVLVAALGALVARSRLYAHAIPAVRSVAVLPLQNLSGDTAQEYFVDGITDALITELARIPGLQVTSRTSSMRYKRTVKSLRDIARELQVDAVIEGSVARDRGQVRIDAQLVEARTDRSIWAESYQRDPRDVFALQADIAARIAHEVHVATTAPRDASQPLPRSADPITAELYFRGRHAELVRNPASIRTAISYYRLAIARDPTFALGYAGLADAYRVVANFAYGPVQPAIDSARIFATRAVRLDSTIAETHAALGAALGDAGEFDTAEREFRRAIELGPSNAQAHYGYASLLVGLGRGSDALREGQRAAALDPFAPGVRGPMTYATWLTTGRRDHLAQPAAKRDPAASLALEPAQPWMRVQNAVNLAEEGKCAEARTEVERARASAGGEAMVLVGEGAVDWRCGQPAHAMMVLRELERRPDARDNALWIADGEARAGEMDSAYAWLERATWTMSKRANLRAARSLALLRSDRRYPELLRHMGLPYTAPPAEVGAGAPGPRPRE